MARDQLDRYFTPDPVAVQLTGEIEGMTGARCRVACVVEAHAGGGAWVRAARSTWPGAPVYGVDIDPAAEGLALCDASWVADWTGAGWEEAAAAVASLGLGLGDVVVLGGNPPFRDAVGQVQAVAKFAERVRRKAGEEGREAPEVWCAWILPTRWLGGPRVWELADMWPVRAWTLYPRIAFLSPGPMAATPSLPGMETTGRALRRLDSPPDDCSLFVWAFWSLASHRATCETSPLVLDGAA